jgi:hypothetical protein
VADDARCAALSDGFWREGSPLPGERGKGVRGGWVTAMPDRAFFAKETHRPPGLWSNLLSKHGTQAGVR